MVLHTTGEPLRLEDVPVPEPEPGQVLLRVSACGVCRTDLHVIDGELSHPKLPLVPGHQVVGRTKDGRRLGVPWLGWTDGTCRYCLSGRENLCESARFTGYDLDGGCSASSGRETTPARRSRSSSAASGRGRRTSQGRRSSTRRSSSRRPASSCPRHCARSPAAASWSAPAST